MHWQPDFERLMEVIDGVLAGHPIYEERLRQWRRIGVLPPILVTAGGWLVNGHHRLIVARERGEELWGLIVERNGEDWIATGNLIRVR